LGKRAGLGVWGSNRASTLTPSCLTPQGLTLCHSAAWLLPALLERGAATLPALSSLTLEAQNAPAVIRRLFADRGLLARLTRLKVCDSHRLPSLPGAPEPEDCPGGMLMEDLEFEVEELVRNAARLAAWPMPRLRRLALEQADRATLRALLHAPWATGLQDLQLTSFEGAFGGEVQSATLRGPTATSERAIMGEHVCQGTSSASPPASPRNLVTRPRLP
jgi:hypothetical protein